MITAYVWLLRLVLAFGEVDTGTGVSTVPLAEQFDTGHGELLHADHTMAFVFTIISGFVFGFGFGFALATF